MITKIMTVIKRVAQRLEVEPTPGGDGALETENGKFTKKTRDASRIMGARKGKIYEFNKTNFFLHTRVGKG